MAIVHPNGGMSGAVGNAVLRTFRDITVAYVRPQHVKNPQTQPQMLQRTKKQNIVNLYGRMKPALKDNFQGKTGKQSDYSMFVSCNLSQLPVYLTEKENLWYHMNVVAPYVVSYGKLVPINYDLLDGWLVSNIRVDDLQISEYTTVSELTESILCNNADWKKGDILEFISCRQKTKLDFFGKSTIPYAECDFANVTLERADRSKLRRYTDELELKVSSDGYLCMKATEEGGYAMVHKRPTPNDVAVGTQCMMVRNSLLEYYCSELHCEEAIKSYRKNKKK